MPYYEKITLLSLPDLQRQSPVDAFVAVDQKLGQSTREVCPIPPKQRALQRVRMLDGLFLLDMVWMIKEQRFICVMLKSNGRIEGQNLELRMRLCSKGGIRIISATYLSCVYILND
jgi:hypothetical protein